ncbi:MAG: maleylpyruvate isomerase family mycothiol-dependent enzyme [Ilumatobacteraceae bacterium]|nr:maleylpyruvate isomerase family mycothiol-dependent enzyme [Ilumatobacteraceae bacterium]
MSKEAVVALRLAVDEVKSVVSSLTDEEWSRPSGCAGWSVRDLVAHMSSNYKETVDPSPLPAEPVQLPAERMMDLLVEPRKDWTNQQILAEYLDYCDKAVDVLASFQDEPLASTVIPLADLGSYPMHQLADAYAFDHYCHLRIDLLAPRGPIERAVPAADATRIGPAVRWMITGMPQMQQNLGASLSAPIVLVLTGPGGGEWTIAPSGSDIVVTAGASAAAVATVSSSGHDFVDWGTQRSNWRGHCSVTGDESVVARFLDALNII